MIMRVLCQTFKNLEARSLFQILLPARILERTNETSPKYFLIENSFADEIKLHMNLVARVSTWSPTGTPNPPLRQNGYINDSQVPQPLLREGELLSSKLYSDLPDRKPGLDLKDESTTYFNGNVKCHKL